MTSFQITLSPSKRAAGRFVNAVRKSLQKAFAEEGQRRGLTQAEVARTIGVNRSVIHRELMGQKDITLGRVAELASAMGRKAVIEFQEVANARGTNIDIEQRPQSTTVDYSVVEDSEELSDTQFGLAA